MLPPRMRRVLTLLISLAMLSGGLWAANIFSGPLEAQSIIAEGAVAVPANSYNCTIYQESESGDYYFQVAAERGTVAVYPNDENSTVTYWQNGTGQPLTPSFNGSSGIFVWSIIGEYSQPQERCLVFSNPDSTSKMVNYEVSRHWTYNNYIGLTAGIAAATAGAIVLALTLLQDKLRTFNKALENQE